MSIVGAAPPLGLVPWTEGREQPGQLASRLVNCRCKIPLVTRSEQPPRRRVGAVCGSRLLLPGELVWPVFVRLVGTFARLCDGKPRWGPTGAPFSSHRRRGGREACVPAEGCGPPRRAAAARVPPTCVAAEGRIGWSNGSRGEQAENRPGALGRGPAWSRVQAALGRRAELPNRELPNRPGALGRGPARPCLEPPVLGREGADSVRTEREEGRGRVCGNGEGGSTVTLGVGEQAPTGGSGRDAAGVGERGQGVGKEV